MVSQGGPLHTTGLAAALPPSKPRQALPHNNRDSVFRDRAGEDDVARGRKAHRWQGVHRRLGNRGQQIRSKE